MELEEIRTYFKSNNNFSDDTKSTDRNTFGFGNLAQLDKNRNSKGWVRAEYVIINDEISETTLPTLKKKWEEVSYVQNNDGDIVAPYAPQHLIFKSSNGWQMCDSYGSSVKFSDIEELQSLISPCSSASATIPIMEFLEKKKNIVLTGAPGTGKTYLARNIAARLIGNCDWNDLPEELKSHCGFVQFHPSYDYTDFVEGLRPEKNTAGVISFDRRDGVFKEFCKRAIEEPMDSIIRFKTKYAGSTVSIPYVESKGDFSINIDANGQLRVILPNSDRPQSATDEDIVECIRTGKRIGNKTYALCIAEFIRKDLGLGKPYVFIIDEINRGELSKIFGELFFAIDPGYRGPAGCVCTQYQNLIPDGDVFKKGFYVPNNVFIIGTMNDIDRGVEAIDFAIRRRFGWRVVTAEESANNMGISDLAKCKMNALNKALKLGGLSPDYYIGGAYFRNINDNELSDLWTDNLCGVVTEYFRGDPDAEEKIATAENEYNNACLSVTNALPESTPNNTSKEE